MTAAEDLMDTADVAAHLGVSVNAIAVGRSLGRGRYKDIPHPLRTASGGPLWLRTDIETWAATLKGTQ